MNGWLRNYRVARAAVSEISEKALGGRVIASFDPVTGAGQSVRAHVARARGIFVDDQGRLRCGENGEFTDLDRSNCVDDAAQEVAQTMIDRVGSVPESMANIRTQAYLRDSGYVPSRSVRIDADDVGVPRVSCRGLHGASRCWS